MEENRNSHCDKISHAIRMISALADQTAVHRKKFEFALTQLKKFHQTYMQSTSDKLLTAAECVAAAQMYQAMNEMKQLISSNLLQTWSLPTIENASGYVLEQLQRVLSKIKETAAILYSDSSLDIDPDSEQWLQYHLLDLRAIHASFTQYLKLPDLDKGLSQLIIFRLQSIDKHLKLSNQGDIAPRVFSPIPVHYQSWRVNQSDFEEIKHIGGGVSANVFYGIDRRTGQEVAIKKFKFQKLNGSKLQAFQREVAVLATARHPALLQLIGATDNLPFCIITEWMPNGSLYHDLHQYHRLDQTWKTIAAYDIARGMQFLHSHQIVHRDLKSLNILLDARNLIRICDFGFSRHASEDSLMTQNIGTPHWMAPEILQAKSNYTAKIDVYAFGIVLWEIATSLTPYAGMESHQIINQVLQNDVRPALPQDINPAMRDLITQCWDRNPDVRPNFDEIVERIGTCEAVFNGASREDVLRYVNESATTGEQLNRNINMMITKVQKGEADLKTALKTFKKTGIPPSLIDGTWNSIIAMKDQFSIEDMVQFDSLFISTSKFGEAAEHLRHLPKNSIPYETINEFIQEIPTGSEETDTNIVVAGCRNGAADLCSVYSNKPSDVALALDVVCQTGVDVQLRAAVIDRCVQCVGSTNVSLSAAAMRCLLTLGEQKRIPFTTLYSFISSADQSLNTCACIALAAIADSNVTLTENLLDVMITRYENDHRSALVLIAACTNAKNAEYILKSLLTEPSLSHSEDTYRILLQSAQNSELHSLVGQILDTLSRIPVSNDNEIESPLLTIQGIIGAKHCNS